MPHQCIKCKKEYPEGSDALLKGCTCGARFFFYYKERLPQQFAVLEQEKRKEILEDVKEAVSEENHPIILDMENIKVLAPGKFEINLVSLFDRNPVIYKHGEGKYVIDIDSTFKMLQRKK